MANKLTPGMADDIRKELDQLDALLVLASANFPRTTRIAVETEGSSPKCRLSLSAFTLRHLITAGRSALNTKGGEGHGK